MIFRTYWKSRASFSVFGARAKNVLSDVMFQFSLYIVPALFSFSKYLGPFCVIPQVRSHTEAGFGCCSLRVGDLHLAEGVYPRILNKNKNKREAWI